MQNAAKKGLLGVVAAVLLLWMTVGDYRPSALDLALAPYRHDMLRWEAGNFPDKWARKLVLSLPWNSPAPRAERIALAEEFFRLGEEIRPLEREFLAGGSGDSGLQARIEGLEQRRRDILPVVEATMESEIATALAEEGFASRIGLILPPVDTVYTRSPGVLVLSPRDRIFRLEAMLLRPSIGDREREALEDLALRERDLSAIVENTGGVALYPSVVSSSGSLHQALITTAHEWLHHWFFFQPLGQHYWDTPEMTTLNETAATLGGRAIGDRAYTAMTGNVVERPPPAGERAPNEPEPDPGRFDFRVEMRETRLHTEDLLAVGRVEEAEAYMEQRRLLMVENGYYIRKINQAYFAFYGSYATSAASVSPIEGQLRGLLERSESLGAFLRSVAVFSSYEEFLADNEGA